MEQILNEPDDVGLDEYEDLEQVTLEVSLRAYALASIAWLLFAEKNTKPQGHEQYFLSQYWQLLKDETDWLGQLSHYIGAPLASDQALVSLCESLNFKPVEMLAISLALAVEEEPMVGRALAHIQAPVSGSRPTFGLLEMAFAQYMEQADGDWVAGTIISGNAVNTGVLNIINNAVPIPEQAFKVTGALSLALRKKHYYWPGTQRLRDEVHVSLPPSLQKLATTYASTLEDGARQAVLVIRNASRVRPDLSRHLSPTADNSRRCLLRPVWSSWAGLGRCA